MRECTVAVSATAGAAAPPTGRVDARLRRVAAPNSVRRSARPRSGHKATLVALLLALLLAAAIAAHPVRGGDPHATVSRLDGVAAPPSAAVSSSAGGWAEMPALERLAVSRGIGADQSPYWTTASGAGVSARNVAQHLSLRFAAGGVTVMTAAGRVHLALRAIRADGGALPIPATAPTAHTNRVSYARGGVTEWYANGPLGLEQGFTVSAKAAAPRSGRGPAATRSLSLSLLVRTSGGLRAAAVRGGIDLLSGRRIALRYDGLSAVDARGRALPAWMTLRGDRLVLHVRTAGARGAVVVDPIMQDGALLAADGQNDDGLGNAVAVSGSLIAVGAANASVGGQVDAGAVYLFSEPPSGWADASGAIKLTNAAPASNAALGTSVAISGNTVLAGATGASVGGATTGAVYLFNEPATGWASENETGELTEPGGNAGDEFGYSLAASGPTVVVGAPLSVDYSGSAYVYTEPAGGWASESPAATLTTNAAGLTGLGYSVAIDGPTIAAGAPLANSLAGQIDVFAEPSGGWANASQTALLSASDGATGDGLGQSVGVSETTVVAGAPGATIGANAGQGAVYLFTRPSSGTWANGNETAKLTAASGGASDSLGSAVAISGPEVFGGAQGAMVGSNTGQGTVYVFSEPAGGWATGTSSDALAETTGNVNDEFGSSLAVSGVTLAVGADGETVNGAGGQGAAFVFGGITPATDVSGSGSGGASTGGPAGSGGGSSGSRHYATVLSVSGGAGRALVSLKCIQTVKCVAANAEIVVDEKLLGRRVVATLAKSSAKARYTYKHVIVGSNHVTLAARAHTTLSVYLNPTGRALFGTHTKLAVGLSVTSVGRTLRLATVTITRPPAAKKKSKKK